MQLSTEWLESMPHMPNMHAGRCTTVHQPRVLLTLLAADSGIGLVRRCSCSALAATGADANSCHVWLKAQASHCATLLTMMLQCAR